MFPHDPDRRDLQRTFDELGFVTGGETMVSILLRAWKATYVSDVTVLLEGETGTGKQVLARAIHQLDQKRKSFPFVTIHCSTISEALAESEFFGHQRGAFSGAVCNRKGLFQSAHRGTLFLDDVNDLPLNLQPKLLDAIQRRAVRPVGSDQEIPVDVRIIAACNQPLKPLVLQSRFRADLYYRLNVVKLTLSPLRERMEELPRLVMAFARRYRHLYHPNEKVEPELLRFLGTQRFSGNVRELEKAVQRMLFLKSNGTSLGLADWIVQSEEEETQADPDPFGKAASTLWHAISRGGVPYAEAIRQMERKVLETALSIEGVSRREIARRLRTSERTLYHKLRAHHLGRHAAL
jgi:transcriptional regulator with PAS, ATPase and Fis domain